MNNLISKPTKTQLKKYNDLISTIKDFGSVAVAFSSGVDSTFLLYAAKEALGDRVIAVTAQSCSFPKRELNEAKDLFHQVRVRIHGMIARIEIMPEEFPKIIQEDIRIQITESFKSFGFTYVSLDLTGYRTGSMNETL